MTPRELARQLLDQAFESIGSARPEVQPNLLWRIGDCYSILDKKKALNILNQAFADGGALQGFSNPGPNIQGQIAVSVSEIDLTRASEMVRSIPGSKDAHVFSFDPRTAAVSRTIERMLAKQDVDAAIELINSLSSDGPFPYEAVSSILSAIQTKDDPRRAIVFGDAITAYQTRPARPFDQMVAKHWRELPRASVVQALDSIVNTVTGYKDSESTYKITYVGKKGTSELGNEQEIELFDVAEPLRECEPAKAKELFESHPALKQAAEYFPEGSASKEIGGMTMMMAQSAGGLPHNTAANARDSAFAANIALWRQGVDKASNNLEAGLDIIGKMSNSDYKAGALIEVAKSSEETNPTVARDLVRKALELLASSKDPDNGYQHLSQAFDVARKLKDTPLTDEILNRSFDMAGQLYKVDADADDPNVMPVDMWPSVDAYRRAMGEAEKLYGIKAVTYLDRVKNPDVFLIAQVALAAALLDRKFFDTKGSVHLKSMK